jgi:nucleoside-diphosphate-sugar epimerase
MRLLVTGGAGFIGSHVVEALLKRSYKVRVLDNLFTGNIDYLPTHGDLEFLEGDVTDYDMCLAAMEDVDGIFHLAAMSKVLPSLANPEMIDFCAAQNAAGTANVLKAALKHKDRVKKLIYSGSSTYYGAGPVPNLEDGPHDCQTPYAVTKYVGEMYCELFTKLHHLPTIRLRYFMTFGPRQPTTGAYAIVTGVFMNRWMQGDPLVILGTGSQTRDFLHVSEVAEANVRAFESDVTNATINVGTGNATTIRELAHVFSDQLEYRPARVPDMPHSLADTSRIRQLLGWVPKTDVINYFKDEVRRIARENPGKYATPSWLAREMSVADSERQ